MRGISRLEIDLDLQSENYPALREETTQSCRVKLQSSKGSFLVNFCYFHYLTSIHFQRTLLRPLLTSGSKRMVPFLNACAEKIILRRIFIEKEIDGWCK